MTVARIALPVAAPQLFDYWCPQAALPAGSIVRVRLARRSLAGVVVETSDASDVPVGRLAPIDEVVATPPLPDDVRELCRFVAGYYQVPPGLAYGLAVPPLARGGTTRGLPAAVALTEQGRADLPRSLSRSPVARALFDRLAREADAVRWDDLAGVGASAGRTLSRWRARGWIRAVERSDERRDAPSLNDEQSSAAASIVASLGRFAPFVLQGVTGSGKTEVYLSAAASCVAAGGQALMLVPEINLTPQLVARVQRALPAARAVALHSGLAAGERRANWEAAATGVVDLVLGTRLAVFVPLPRLALVVVDEEHDASYKQQDVVRYHARDAAVWRARHRGVPVVLGSATPCLETYAHGRSGRYATLRLRERAGAGALPRVEYVAARGDTVRDGLSTSLMQALDQTLKRGEQSLLFVNRRGYAPSLKCAACGWEAGCARCSARLTTHRVPPALVCHHCGHRERIPAACPSCGNVDLLPRGQGTQRLEQTLAAAFPAARIARVDRDSTQRRDAFESVKRRVERNELDILVGTQMLAKGHDFPRLTLVGVVGADNALYSADFRATERLAALLVQVAGRAGRAEHRGQVIVQTNFPRHPMFAALARHDYDAFAAQLLEEREVAGLPPFAHLALVTAESHRRDDADAFLARLHAAATGVREHASLDVEVFSPVPAALARRAGFERSQMLMRSSRRGELQRLLAGVREVIDAASSRRVRWAIDVDPASVA